MIGSSSFVIVLSTFPADGDVTAFARALVDERLAACVNVLPPMDSIYRWQGAVEQASERQLIMKTTSDRVDQLKQRIAALHPYEVPEIIVLPISGGGDAYLTWVGHSVVAAFIALVLVFQTATLAAQSEVPRPVRNDRAQPARELLVLRHHQLRKGGHEEFYRLSAENVWPFFEHNGARIVGQWKIVEGEQLGDFDHVYRLVRYAGFAHWQATRSTRSSGAASVGGGGADVALGGNGPAHARSIGGYADRGELEVGSKGAYFLEGVSAPGGPYFMPGLNEQYEAIDTGRRAAASDDRIPVRVDVAQRGAEIVEVRYLRIQKGSYDRFVAATRTSVWPWEEKLGARPMGQWLVVHPAAPSRTTASSAYDEVVTMTRYASRAHRDAMQPDVAVFMGGNGPDYEAWREALRLQGSLIVAERTEIAEGMMYNSPPKFLPGLPERYRLRK